jgi:hypothetical protein
METSTILTINCHTGALLASAIMSSDDLCNCQPHDDDRNSGHKTHKKIHYRTSHHKIHKRNQVLLILTHMPKSN